MVTVCNNRCARIAFKVRRMANQSLYGLDLKYCCECEKYLKWNTNRCPCCNLRLRTRPRDSGGKRSFLLSNSSRVTMSDLASGVITETGKIIVIQHLADQKDNAGIY